MHVMNQKTQGMPTRTMPAIGNQTVSFVSGKVTNSTRNAPPARMMRKKRQEMNQMQMLRALPPLGGIGAKQRLPPTRSFRSVDSDHICIDCPL